MHRRSFLAVAPVALLLAGAAASSFAQTVIPFAEGPGEATFPSDYAVVRDPGVGLAVATTPEPKVRLFFDLHKLDAAVRVANPGEIFVREQAEKKGRKVRIVGNKLVMFEPGKPTEVDGEQVVNLHWHVGFGRTVVIMSAAIHKRDSEHPLVKRFLEKDLESIVTGLRRTGA